MTVVNLQWKPSRERTATTEVAAPLSLLPLQRNMIGDIRKPPERSTTVPPGSSGFFRIRL